MKKSLSKIKSDLLKKLRNNRVSKENRDIVEKAFEEIKKNYIAKSIFNIKDRALTKTRKERDCNKFLVQQTWSNLRALGLDYKKFKETNKREFEKRYNKRYI